MQVSIVWCLQLVLAVAAAYRGDPSTDTPVAKWHNQFTVSFNETMKFGPLLHWQTDGTWYYDAVSGKEMIYRENGRGDRYCKSVHALTNTPCQHIVNDGNRYLMFPDLKECCKCCDSSRGCGTLSPSWLDDATYEGTEMMFGQSVYKFSKKGLQPNYYYTTADSVQLPVELDQIPNDFMTFKLTTFSKGAPEPSVFEVPEFCQQKCPITSLCTIAAAAS